MNSSSFSQTMLIEGCIERLNKGDDTAREDLLNIACERLMNMTRKIKKEFPGLMRWEQTDDIFQNASLRLYQALSDVTINDSLHFFRLAALNIRRELIDLARHYQGPMGLGANHHTQGVVNIDQSQMMPAYEKAEMTHDPKQVAEWGELHEAINKLPEEEKEVFDLLFYHEVPYEEAAEVLKIGVRQLRRRWRAARIHLQESLGGESPLP